MVSSNLEDRTVPNRNLDRALFRINVYLVYVHTEYGLVATETETFTGHYFEFSFRQSFYGGRLPVATFSFRAWSST